MLCFHQQIQRILSQSILYYYCMRSINYVLYTILFIVSPESPTISDQSSFIFQQISNEEDTNQSSKFMLFIYHYAYMITCLDHFLLSLPIQPTLSLTTPQSHLALLDTELATFFAPSCISPDSNFSCTFRIPSCPISLVLLPSHTAFSFAESNISSALISVIGISSLLIILPSQRVGCCPSALPSSMARQKALALQVTMMRTYASSSPYCFRNLPKLSLPPRSMRSTYSRLHSSRLMLLIWVTQEKSRKAAAQLRQRKMAWVSSAHCLLGRPQWKQRALAQRVNSFYRDAEGEGWSCSINIQYYILKHRKTFLFKLYIIKHILSLVLQKECKGADFYFQQIYMLQAFYMIQQSSYQVRLQQFKSMNLKVDRVLPYPPTTVKPFILTYISAPAPALLLYASVPPPDKPQQPKKKFAFKANVPAVASVENVHIFDIAKAQWRTQQTKGKFPTRRQNPVTTCMGPCLMLYGGNQLTPAKQVNDLYALNLSTWQWKKLFAMQAPPPHPHTLAISLGEDRLAVVTRTVWIFEAKEVIWSAESTDLPGGIWRKVKDCEIPFEPRCGYLCGDRMVVFGMDKMLEAVAVRVEKEGVSRLTIEGEFKGKGRSVELMSTSEGKGILVDGCFFGSFFVDQQNITIGEWAESGQVQFERIVMVETPQIRANYGITTKKELASARIVIAVPEPVQQDLPNTARQVTSQDVPHHSSLIERDYNQDSFIPPASPAHSQTANNALSQNLSALLAREWLRRRVLQEKGRLLQETIKKAERMVIALCSYGDEEEKSEHIGKVSKLRKALCRVFQSQSMLKQRMLENGVGLQLRERALRSVKLSSAFAELRDNQ